jgi:UrcA family protein
MKKMATQKAKLTFGIIASLLAFSTPALAEGRSKMVRTSDLNLATPDGQAELQSRIDRAIKTVCVSNSAITLADMRDAHQCETAARAAADAQVSQRIAAYQDYRKGRSQRAVTLASD